MQAPTAAIRRLSYSSRDLGAVEAFWRNDLKARVAFDQDICGPGPFRFNSASLGGVSTGLLQPNISYTVFDGPADSYTVSQCTRGRTTHDLRGAPYTGVPGQLAIYHPGVDARASWLQGGSEVTYLRFEPWVLERHLEQLLDGPVTGPLVLPRLARPLTAWWELLTLFNRLLLDVDDPLTRPAVIAPLCEALLSGLLLTLDHQYRDALTRPAPPCQLRYIRHAVDAIHAFPEQPHTVAALAKLGGVSVRTLQQGFRTHLNTSPMAYLRQVRLARAHDDLVRDSQLSVAEVACRWGFTHLSRFAAAYAKEYGELPSDARYPRHRLEPTHPRPAGRRRP